MSVVSSQKHSVVYSVFFKMFKANLTKINLVLLLFALLFCAISV